ncbi:MAG: RluA family pseudouridine synthase [Deltaproteobacteria bacterium]|nr:RluA family pseudouridine synthase [Deltaproteobacteria bacterium]
MSLLTKKGDLWVLNKPSGMLTHPAVHDARAARNPLPDLMTWAKEELEAPDSLAPCHRLDLATSGVLLASPDPEVRGAIGKMFAAGEVTKKYKALVVGRTNRKGTIRRKLQDGRRGRPLDAVTRYRLDSWLGPFSLITARPETGRKHQIRRHLQSIGHAVVGDDRYPPKRFRKVPGFPGRLWLHANELTLPDGQRFRAPLPDELADHLELLVSMNEEPISEGE